MFESRETAAVAEAALAGQELSRGKNAGTFRKAKETLFNFLLRSNYYIAIDYLLFRQIENICLILNFNSFGKIVILKKSFKYDGAIYPLFN